MRTRYLIMLILACLFQIQFVSSQTNKLYIPPTNCPFGKTTNVEMQMDNQSEVVALQFNLHIPDVVTFDKSGMQLAEERKDDHKLSVTDKGGNNYLVIVMSMDNKPFKNASGALIKIPLVVPDGLEIDKEYPFQLSNVVLSDRSGKNVMTSFDAGKIKIVDGNGPDITPTDIQLSSDNFQPGGKVSLAWNVENIGGKPSEDGWSEQLYLVDESGNEYSLGKGSYNEIIGAKGKIARRAEYNISEFPGIEGKVQAKVVLTAFSEWELPVYRENNEGISKAALDMPKVLTWNMNETSIQEKGSPEFFCTLKRSGSRNSAEVFNIKNGNSSRLQLPGSVTIPEGESGVSFKMKVIDDTVANSDSFVVATVIGDRYKELKQEIWIEDDEHPYLKISVNQDNVAEGKTFTITVEREWTIKWPLVVKLSSDHPKRFDNWPAEVIIPENVNKKEVTIRVKDDDLPGLDDEVVFTASAPGYVFDLTCKRFIKVLDNDVPNIELMLSTSTASEAGQVITAKLKRKGITDNKITVNLTHNGGNRINIPSTIVLEAGISEKEFAIQTVDNAMKDGDQTVTIKGAIYISSCNCSTAGTTAGVFEKQITVLDDDDAAVKSIVSKTTLLEGESGKITISVNEVLDRPLSINLSSDSNDLQFATSATIEVGKSSVDVDVKVSQNSVSEGNRVATVVIDAGTYGKSTCWLNITDQTLPDAVVTTFETEKDITVQHSVTVSATVKNEGAAVLPAQTKVSVYLSTSTGLNFSATALGSLYTQKELAVGESETLSKTMTFPDNAGAYYLIAIVNEDQSKKELSYVNNNATPFAVQLKPLYTVQVSLDKTVLKTGESVTINGQVSGSKIANVPADLYIINNGYRDVVKVTTDNSGFFQTSYTPKNGFYGHFAVGACYPDEGLEKEMTGFDLYGLKKASYEMINWEVFTNEKMSGHILLKNPGNKDLSGITAKIISQPKNCTISFSSVSNLAVNKTAELRYEVIGTAVSTGVDWEPVKVQVSSKEGAILDLDIRYYCRSHAAQLEISEPNINTTMTIGSSREYPVTITNTGKGETGEIRVVLPNVDWMSLATPAKMASLKYGESATVLLRLAPNASMEANIANTGRFAINCANGNGVPVSYRITPVSSEKGTLIVDVCDEYTYYTAEKPHVRGADVRVTMPNTNTVVAEGKTDANGLFTSELPSGSYTVEVKADKHDSYKNTVLVDPGKKNETVVNLSFQAITYSWEVVETEVEDQYETKIVVNYETNVPAPVVVVDFPDALAYEDQVFTITATNKGLIAAQNLSLVFPEIPNVQFELLSENSGEVLPAQQSRIFYVKMIINPIQTRGSIIGCIAGAIGIYYTWYCGLEEKLGVAMNNYTWGECSTMFPAIFMPTSGMGGGSHPSDSYGKGREFIDWESLANYLSQKPNMKRDCTECEQSFINAFKKCFDNLWKLVGIKVKGKDFDPKDLKLNVKEEAKKVWESLRNKGLDCVKEQLEKDITQNPLDLKNIIPCLKAKVQKENEEKIKEILDDNIGCLLRLLDPCNRLNMTPTEENKDEFAEKSKEAYSDAPSFIRVAMEHIPLAREALKKEKEIINEIFGEDGWFERIDDAKESIAFLDGLDEVLGKVEDIFNLKLEDLLPYKPSDVSVEQIQEFIKRWNNSKNQGIWTKSSKSNFISIGKLKQLFEEYEDLNRKAMVLGFESIADMWAEDVASIYVNENVVKTSVCASISLQFSQTMVMTRQAFRGTLTVNNGHEIEAMKNIKLDLIVSDEDGIVATKYEFEISPEKLDGFGGNLDGVWTLDAQKTGTASILFIPTKYAAPTEPKDYTFGGTLSYIDPFTGLEVTRDLFPVTLTVQPSPNLKLTYFVQRDIMGDDPLTPNKVEPSVPAEFSLLIQNTGAGDATKVNMITNQPEIVDNEKGLAIDFELLNSVLNGEEKSLALGGSVATNFGTIPAGQTAYAQWWFTSTLLGNFVTYKVEATHVTSYDNPNLSLLDGEPTIHELIRSIKVPKSDLAGFLVNDLEDDEYTPDMIYLTDGTIETVSKASAKIEKNGDQYTLTATPSTGGWSYGSLTDPTGGRQKLVSIIRQDGQMIDLLNVWQTSCTVRNGKAIYENRIHFADKINGNTTYKLTFEPGPDVILEVASFDGIPANNEVAEKPVTEITVHFNKAIEPETFTTEDLTLVLQGQQRDASPIHIKQKDKQTFVLDLTEVSKLDGFYVLTVQTAGITDYEGFLGESGKNVSWTQYLAPGYQTLSMELASGWNWISTNMEGVSNPVSLLTPVKEKVKRMQSQSQEVTNDPQLGLVGNLDKVASETFYKLEMNANGKIDITGTVLTPNQVEIGLKTGWNWIGYIPRSATTPTKALALLTANVGDEVKGQAGFAQFNGSTWVGTLDKMEPGKGYMYKAAKSQTLQYPIVSSLDATVSLRSVDLKSSLKSELKSPWTVDIHKYPNNMSVIANLWFDEVKQEPDQYVIAAFCGDECRGIGKYVDDKLFITIYGDKAGENITFRAALNGGSSQWKIKETVSFSETTQGTLTSPFDLHLSEQTTGNDIILTQNGIYPNPVSRLLYIKGDTEDIRRVQVVGGNGAVLMKQGLNGGNSIDVSPLSSGLYILVIERNNNNKPEFHKFIKK